jgi:UDP-glucose 4-epimerase
MFTEDMAAKRLPRSGYAKDVLEVEGYVRGFARRRPDVSVTMLRAASLVGPNASGPVIQYFRMPVVPTVLGFDARLQFLHETDLIAALRHATIDGVHGTFNLAGSGILMLSQALRRLGRPTVAVPGFALGGLGGLLKQAGLGAVSQELTGFLTFGRGVDTTRARDVLGFVPDYSTAEAFADLARTISPGFAPSARTVAALLPEPGGEHA